MRFHLTFEETWIHRVNPSFKLLVFLCLFGMILFTHNINFILPFTLASLIIYMFFTGHPKKRLLLFSLPFVLIFVSTSSSMILFGKGETTWFHWGLIHITEESFFRGIHLGFRALNFAMLGLIFALTTRPVYLFYSLMQQCKVPPKYAYSFMAGLRLIPMMLEELETLHYALKIRGVPHEHGIRRFFFTSQGFFGAIAGAKYPPCTANCSSYGSETIY